MRIVPVYQRLHDRELHADVRRTIGFRALCDCGWRGPVRRTVREARETVRDHAAGAV